MTVSVEYSRKNLEFALWVKNQPPNIRRGIRQGFFAVGEDLVKESRRLIRRPPKTGRLYRIAGRRRRHRASAPGEAPANLTGALARSIAFSISGSDNMEFGSRTDEPGAIKTGEYAAILENGSAKISARPYIKPSVEKVNRRARNRFESALKRAMMK